MLYDRPYMREPQYRPSSLKPLYWLLGSLVGVFFLLSHLASVRDHGLEVVRITVIPRLDGMRTSVAGKKKSLSHQPSFCLESRTMLRTGSILLLLGEGLNVGFGPPLGQLARLTSPSMRTRQFGFHTLPNK